MPNWCFKCRTAIESSGEACPVCGVPFPATSSRAGFSLTSLAYLDEDEIVPFLSKQYGVPAVDLDEIQISSEVLALIPIELARRHVLIPLSLAGRVLVIAMADPSNIFAIDQIKRITKLDVEVVVASDAAVTRAIEIRYA